MNPSPITPDEIRTLRKSHGVTQRQVARMLHTSRKTVANWENGRSTMNKALMELLVIKLKRRKK